MKKAKSKQVKATQASLARALKVNKQTVHYHVKAGCEIPLNDVQGWRDYLAEIGREGSLPADIRKAIGKARARLLQAQVTKAERENQKEQGLLMLRSEAKIENAKAWAFVFEMIDRRLCNEYPPLLQGRNAVEIFEQLCAFREELRKSAKDKFEKAA